MNNKTDETYVPLSRGLLEHLPDLPGNVVKVYIYLLINAKFKGKDKGKFAATFEDIALALGMHRITVWKVCQELKPKYIDYKAGTNQFDINIFTIQNYKATEDFKVVHRYKKSGGVSPQTNSKNGKNKSGVSQGTNSKNKVGVSPRETACKRRGNSNFNKANGKKDLQKRNNVNNVKNVLRGNFSLKKDLKKQCIDVIAKKKKEIGVK